MNLENFVMYKIEPNYMSFRVKQIGIRIRIEDYFFIQLTEMKDGAIIFRDAKKLMIKEIFSFGKTLF